MKCRIIVPGNVEGEVLYTEEPISFYGGVDLRTGTIIQKGHELEGKKISGKILVFPHGIGSTVGSYVIYGLKKYGVAPLAIINQDTETIIATGAILANIPCFDKVDIRILENVKRIRIENGEIKILE